MARRVCLGLLQLLAPAVGAGGGPLLPGMAWNSWNTFSVNGKPLRSGREGYQQIAEVMIERGYVKAGYRTLSTTCTDWQPRDPITHELQENHTLWPGGMKSFADWLHARGMELVVYTDAGVKNCCQEPGSLGYEDIDMKTLSPWITAAGPRTSRALTRSSRTPSSRRADRPASACSASAAGLPTGGRPR